MLFHKLAAFYKTVHWEMVQVPNETILSTTYAGENGQWTFVASSDEPHGIVILFARVPHTCSLEQYATMSAFLEQANFGMTHGAWVMDRTDGEIRYRVGVDVGGLDLSCEYLQSLTLYTNLTMDQYLPGLRAILEDDKTAEEAFELVFS